MANLKGSDNPFPSILVEEGTEPAAPAAGFHRLYVDSTTHTLHRVDEAGVEVDIEDAGASGDVATDTIWNAAGDLAVGTGSDTAARLAMGAEGSVLSVMDGVVGWNGATSMPGSPTTGQRVWRSDLMMDFVYDGTRWLCTCPHSIDVGMQHALLTVSANNSLRAAAPESLTATVWLTSLTVGIFVATTNDASKYWTVGLTGAASPASTQSLAADTVHYLSQTLNAVFTIATTKWIQVDYIKVSTAGAAYPLARLNYRHIGT